MPMPPAPRPAAGMAKPLFVKGQMQEFDHPLQKKEPANLQVWPRTVVEHRDGRHQLFRTAGITNHLRAMAGRSEMITTQAHDYGFMERHRDPGAAPSTLPAPYQHGSAAAAAATAVLNAPSTATSGRSSIRTGTPAVGPHVADRPLSASWDAQAAGDALQLSARGWDSVASRWTPGSHPHMVHGHTNREIALIQTGERLNLRGPREPSRTRQHHAPLSAR
mmetsp:Transcript_118109/g.333978  ORF Transcript_118109/g.333978 Transcript_118109/m.333978 type:complete len:220 (+) Transcript_118109:72-731(+)